MHKHMKKMIAPIIISIIIVLYYVFIAAFVLSSGEVPGLAKFLLVVVPLVLSGVMIGVLISRINEIRSGEEDDLSKY